MNTLITNGIKVSVENRYQEEASNPALNRHIHSYQVTIENQSQRPIKLISRYWLIIDGDGTKREVRGEGVIGKQPTLHPGQVHTYSSWCPLSFPTGKMQGYYNMKYLDTAEMMKVNIPPFTMTAVFKEN